MEKTMDDFYGQLKNYVWFIKTVYMGKSPRSPLHTIGFAVAKDSVITCGHAIETKELLIKMKGRCLGVKLRSIEMEIEYLDKTLDLVRLKPKNRSVELPYYAELATSGDMRIGERLYHIGHSICFVGSFMTGLVNYPCLDNVNPPKSDDAKKCIDYKLTVVEVTPNYRVMGHIWNSTCLKKEYYKVYERNLNPHSQIIQAFGFYSSEGSSGGPIFNSEGKIVGMLVMGCFGHDIGLHLSTLKKFLKDADSSDERAAKRQK